MSEALMNMTAQAKLQEVEELASKLGAAESMLEVGYGQLAVGLREVADQQYWRGSYESFGQYIEHLKSTHNIGRAQLYNYLSSARVLENDVTTDELSKMGISKAMVLTKAKQGKDDSITPAALAAALDPKVSVKDLKKLLFEAGAIMEPDQSSWMDCEFEFMVDDNEREVINSAISAARHTDPVTPSDIKEYAQRKDIMLKLCMAYLADHAALAIEGEV
jgi:predicted small metal-binding protein